LPFRQTTWFRAAVKIILYVALALSINNKQVKRQIITHTSMITPELR
jgi:hypothetical protein